MTPRRAIPTAGSPPEPHSGPFRPTGSAPFAAPARPISRSTRTELAEAGPEPGTELNRGEPTKPRQAATVILLRGGSERLEVLLAKRNPAQRFMGGAWVFPGGAVDTDDGEGTAAHRAAGVREVAEEVGIELPDPDALVRFSRWITPAMVKIRFDTHFFLVAAPEGAEPEPDGSETVDLGWFTPQGALDAHERGEV